MLIKRSSDILPSEITPEAVYLKRRELLKIAGIASAGLVASPSMLAAEPVPGDAGKRLAGIRKSPFSTDQEPNSWSDVTTYNNYYEFGTGKTDPAANAGSLVTAPWTVEIDGPADQRDSGTCLHGGFGQGVAHFP